MREETARTRYSSIVQGGRQIWYMSLNESPTSPTSRTNLVYRRHTEHPYPGYNRVRLTFALVRPSWKDITSCRGDARS